MSDPAEFMRPIISATSSSVWEVRRVSRGAPLPCCITNPSCGDFSTVWIFWKSLFTSRIPVQLLSGPEWVKFLITETQMNWNHSLALRIQIFIISATPRLSGQGRWILGFSLKCEDSSHCFVPQIKLAKSAGFGARSIRDQMCCAWQKSAQRSGLSFCSCFASMGSPSTNIPSGTKWSAFRH